MAAGCHRWAAVRGLALRTRAAKQVHHCSKEHPYQLLAEDLCASRPSPAPLVLGLTATYSYHVTLHEMEADLKKLCTGAPPAV